MTDWAAIGIFSCMTPLEGALAAEQLQGGGGNTQNVLLCAVRTELYIYTDDIRNWYICCVRFQLVERIIDKIVLVFTPAIFSGATGGGKATERRR